MRNHLNNVGKGKGIEPPVVFLGGVASNVGMKDAFERALGCQVRVPPHIKVMRAFGAAILAREHQERVPGPPRFRGLALSWAKYNTRTLAWGYCSNRCEIVEIVIQGSSTVRWGGRSEQANPSTESSEQGVEETRFDQGSVDASSKCTGPASCLDLS